MSEQINVFIPHSGRDEEYVEPLKALIERSGKYDIRDSSIVESEPNNANNTEYIKSLIRPKIDWAKKIIVLIGPDTHKREWVDWEINYATKNGEKEIIGVFLRGATDSDVPTAMEEYGFSCVAWNSQSIVDALENPTWENSDGTKREKADYPRGDC